MPNTWPPPHNNRLHAHCSTKTPSACHQTVTPNTCTPPHITYHLYTIIQQHTTCIPLCSDRPNAHHLTTCQIYTTKHWQTRCTLPHNDMWHVYPHTVTGQMYTTTKWQARCTPHNDGQMCTTTQWQAICTPPHNDRPDVHHTMIGQVCTTTQWQAICTPPHNDRPDVHHTMMAICTPPHNDRPDVHHTMMAICTPHNDRPDVHHTMMAICTPPHNDRPAAPPPPWWQTSYTLPHMEGVGRDRWGNQHNTKLQTSQTTHNESFQWFEMITCALQRG